MNILQTIKKKKRMSLINKVAAIIGSKKSLDEVTYLDNMVSYDDTISILDIPLSSIIPPPPENSSLVTEKEIANIAKVTKSRSNQELDLIVTVDKDPLELFYNYMYGKGMKFPKTKFLDYYNILEQYVYALKYRYNRARPNQLAPYYDVDIQVLGTKTHHTPAYPSGHTMYSELAAKIASEEYPEHEKAFFKLSNYCGFARILQGVHYESDNKASKVVVDKLYPLIKEYINEQDSKNFPSYRRT